MPKAKILVTDDDRDIRDSLQAILESRDYAVVTAADKNEGMDRIREETLSMLFRLQLVRRKPDEISRKKKRDMHLIHGEGGDKPVTVRRKGKKVGRNDPCPCGSGKKYKKCCGAGK